MPRTIVLRGSPVTRLTAAIPPRPQATASVPAHSRRVRSFSAIFNASYFAASIRSLPMPSILAWCVKRVTLFCYGPYVSLRRDAAAPSLAARVVFPQEVAALGADAVKVQAFGRKDARTEVRHAAVHHHARPDGPQLTSHRPPMGIARWAILPTARRPGLAAVLPLARIGGKLAK